MRFTAQVKGGLHANYSSSLSSAHLTSNNAWTTRAVQMLSRKGMYGFRELLDTLIGQAPGNNTRFGYGEIQPSVELGGLRPVAKTYLIDRLTTAADVVNLKAGLTELSEATHTVEQAVNQDRNPLGTR
jgi:hypothetical protein